MTGQTRQVCSVCVCVCVCVWRVCVWRVCVWRVCVACVCVCSVCVCVCSVCVCVCVACVCVCVFIYLCCMGCMGRDLTMRLHSNELPKYLVEKMKINKLSNCTQPTISLCSLEGIHTW